MQLNGRRRTFRCTKRSCNVEFSCRKHTFFFGSSLNCAEILHLAYMWLNKSTQTQSMNQTGHSAPTVTVFHKHFRRLVSSTLDESNTIIGGPNIIVEVDETKLGKRKYYRGHRVDGVWVVAGVELTAERKVFLVKVDNRSAKTLLEIIEKHVAPGSIVHTDMHRGYCRLESQLGITHHTVNHSKFFKDPVTGIHTNTIEGTNNGLKIMIKPRNRNKNIDDHLAEFIWRRMHHGNLWDSFIEALRIIHYDFQ